MEARPEGASHSLMNDPRFWDFLKSFGRSGNLSGDAIKSTQPLFTTLCLGGNMSSEMTMPTQPHCTTLCPGENLSGDTIQSHSPTTSTQLCSTTSTVMSTRPHSTTPRTSGVISSRPNAFSLPERETNPESASHCLMNDPRAWVFLQTFARSASPSHTSIHHTISQASFFAYLHKDSKMDTLASNQTKMISLPLEILQNIIGFLPTDNDVANFSYTCRALGSTVTDTVWRERCMAQFDPVALDASSTMSLLQQYKNAYVARRKIAKGTVKFNMRYTYFIYPLSDVAQALNTLKQVIVEAKGRYEGSDDFNGTEPRSRNHEFLVKCLNGPHGSTDLLSRLFELCVYTAPMSAQLKNTNGGKDDGSTPLQPSRETIQYLTDNSLNPMVFLRAKTIQLLLSHLLLHPELCQEKVTSQKFRESQWVVYQHHRTQPLFLKDPLLAHPRTLEGPSKNEEYNASLDHRCSSTRAVKLTAKEMSEGIPWSSSDSITSTISAYKLELARIPMLGEGLSVNIDVLLHIVNFFRYHIKNPLGVLALSFSEEVSGREFFYPRKSWDACLMEEGCVTKSLNTHWIGSYTWLPALPIQVLRDIPSPGTYEIVGISDFPSALEPSGFESIVFNFDSSTFTDEEASIDFTAYFSTPIGPQSPFPHPFPHSPVSLPRVLPFRGEVVDGFTWKIAGHIHCLPHQSENGGHFFGFQRINFIKYLVDQFHQPKEVYVYEGCVLPGRQMILGTWWSWSNQHWGDEDWSGPFVMWVGDREPNLL